MPGDAKDRADAAVDKCTEDPTLVALCTIAIALLKINPQEERIATLLQKLVRVACRIGFLAGVEYTLNEVGFKEAERACLQAGTKGSKTIH